MVLAGANRILVVWARRWTHRVRRGRQRVLVNRPWTVLVNRSRTMLVHRTWASMRSAPLQRSRIKRTSRDPTRRGRRWDRRRWSKQSRSRILRPVLGLLSPKPSRVINALKWRTGYSRHLMHWRTWLACTSKYVFGSRSVGTYTHCSHLGRYMVHPTTTWARECPRRRRRVTTRRR